MAELLRRIIHELGSGRAVSNACTEQHEQILMEARVDALGRRLERPPVEITVAA